MDTLHQDVKHISEHLDNLGLHVSALMQVLPKKLVDKLEEALPKGDALDILRDIREILSHQIQNKTLLHIETPL